MRYNAPRVPEDSARGEMGEVMKEKIFELMERSLLAYSDEHIKRYFEDVKRDGLTEHGFPRLTANIGILISHGRRVDLLPVFLEMMELCCKSFPSVKAANDFSVREIVSCIREVKKSGIAPSSDIARWKEYLAKIDPVSTYNVFATEPTDKVKNWALFTALSEFFRMEMGLGGSEEFIDIQLATQVQWLDENGMYMDGKGDTHHPIVYDLVPRGLFSLLLAAGYRGRYFDEIDAALRRAGLLTLKMQSPNGEVAFGGRSNQFIHNEPWMLAIFAYEAGRYAREGNVSLAGEFRAAMKRALDVTEEWLSREPILHIKNRFPTETKYGCERYAYFDKYMITVASNLYAAYLMYDGEPLKALPDRKPSVCMTSEHFHKLFLKAGGYGLEFDLDGDSHYDASGLGRVHREDAPSPICMSAPCPSEPIYTVDIESQNAVSLCTGASVDGKIEFAIGPDTKYEVVSSKEGDVSANASIITHFASGTDILAEYTVSAEGVDIRVSGEGEVFYMLPAFCFDGEAYADIEAGDVSLSINYRGWVCRYETDGKIIDLGRMAANRNGHYKVFSASGDKTLNIKIQIIKA